MVEKSAETLPLGAALSNLSLFEGTIMIRERWVNWYCLCRGRNWRDYLKWWWVPGNISSTILATKARPAEASNLFFSVILIELCIFHGERSSSFEEGVYRFYCSYQNLREALVRIMNDLIPS